MLRSQRELSSINLGALGTLFSVGLTSQSLNCPLFELLECNFRRWRSFVEVQAVRILLLPVKWCCKLLFLMINGTSPLWINTTELLSDHSFRL